MADPEDGAAGLEQPHDASNEDDVQRQRTATGRRDKRLNQVFLGIVNSPDGREWLYDFMQDLRVFTVNIITGDLYTTAFQAGEREAGFRLMRRVARDFPVQFAQMMKDHDRG